ncbi:MAG: aldehyde dehydrogenase family protein [Pseudomonadota bacterium]
MTGTCSTVNPATGGDFSIHPMMNDAELAEYLSKVIVIAHDQSKAVVADHRVRGGTVPEGEGFYDPAPSLKSVSPGPPACNEELLGPVASLIRAKNADDAMRSTIDRRFGLSGGIMSGNVERAVALAKTRFDTGMVFIDGFGLAAPGRPFGGVTNSGYGREHGGSGIREFVNAKAAHMMAAA